MATLKEKLDLLKDLETENETIEREIEGLIGEMERVPPEERSAGEWGPSGTLTQRFVELSERQNELAEEMKTLRRAIGSEKPPESVH